MNIFEYFGYNVEMLQLFLDVFSAVQAEDDSCIVRFENGVWGIGRPDQELLMCVVLTDGFFLACVSGNPEGEPFIAENKGHLIDECIKAMGPAQTSDARHLNADATLFISASFGELDGAECDIAIPLTDRYGKRKEFVLPGKETADGRLVISAAAYDDLLQWNGFPELIVKML